MFNGRRDNRASEIGEAPAHPKRPGGGPYASVDSAASRPVIFRLRLQCDTGARVKEGVLPLGLRLILHEP